MEEVGLILWVGSVYTNGGAWLGEGRHVARGGEGCS